MMQAERCILLKETDLPPSYSFEEEQLASLLELSCDAVLFFRHPQAQVLPLGQVKASKLVFYQEAVSFWGWRRLRKIAKWWMANYFFSVDGLDTSLTIGSLRKVAYKNRLLGGLIGDSIWFNTRGHVIYSSKQLSAFAEHLSKREAISFVISELSVKSPATFFSLG